MEQYGLHMEVLRLKFEATGKGCAHYLDQDRGFGADFQTGISTRSGGGGGGGRVSQV